jgi:hypothetical protein
LIGVGHVQASGLTGADGRATLAFAAELARPAILVSRGGFVPCSLAIAPDAKQMVVDLAEGVRVAGRVVATDGQGIDGARVSLHRLGSARPESDLPIHLEEYQGPVDGLQSAVASSDGSFTFHVPPGAIFEISTSADGWCACGPTDFPALTRDGAPDAGFPVTRSVVRSGEEDILLTLYPFRVFVARFVDATSRDSVSGFLGNLQPLLRRDLGRARLVEPARVGLRGPPWQGMADGYMGGVVLFSSSRALADDLDMYVQVDGYAPAVARIPLRVLSSAKAQPHVSEVVLSASAGLGSSGVLFELEGPPHGLDPSGPVRVTLQVKEEWWQTFSATRQPDGSWRSTRLPAGSQVLRIFDGVRWSANLRVDLEPGVTQRVAPTFGPLTGITLSATNEAGEAVFGGALAIGALSDDQPFDGQASVSRNLLRFDNMNAAALDDSTGVRLMRFLPLNPGKYVFVFERPGFMEATGTFELRGGDTVNLEPRLREDSR